MAAKPKALVLRTAGTNCDQETLHALRTAGAQADLLHLREVAQQPRTLLRYAILVIPGGFSYGDDVAAGRILANELKFRLGHELQRFVEDRRIVIGVCNGFQVLAKAGFLPGQDIFDLVQTATLAQNDSGRFQCQWVGMKREPSRAGWLDALPRTFELPIAHGEGKFVPKDARLLREIERAGQVVFRYDPVNPNGSVHAIAGVCNPWGNVVGLMPHPERYLTPWQHPAWARRKAKEPTPGLLFWKAAVERARKSL